MTTTGRSNWQAALKTVILLAALGGSWSAPAI